MVTSALLMPTVVPPCPWLVVAMLAPQSSECFLKIRTAVQSGRAFVARWQVCTPSRSRYRTGDGPAGAVGERHGATQASDSEEVALRSAALSGACRKEGGRVAFLCEESEGE